MAKNNFNIMQVALLIGVAVVAISLVVNTTGFSTSSYTGNPGTPGKQVEFCTDPDGTDTQAKSQCTDIEGRHTDYCNTDTEIIEYACKYDTCQPADPVRCSTGKCVDGRCMV